MIPGHSPLLTDLYVGVLMFLLLHPSWCKKCNRSSETDIVMSSELKLSHAIKALNWVSLRPPYDNFNPLNSRLCTRPLGAGVYQWKGKANSNGQRRGLWRKTSWSSEQLAPPNQLWSQLGLLSLGVTMTHFNMFFFWFSCKCHLFCLLIVTYIFWFLGPMKAT